MSHILTKASWEIYSLLKVFGMKVLNGSNFRVGKLPYFKGHVSLEQDKASQMSLGRHIKMQSGTRVGVRGCGKLSIGDHCSINVGALIVCHDQIEIGEHTQIGPYCQIYDHDHSFHSVNALDAQEFTVAPVKIGSHVWIGGSCIILKGSTIGDNCVIAAGSIVKGNIPANSLVYCKRNEVIKEIVRSRD